MLRYALTVLAATTMAVLPITADAKDTAGAKALTDYGSCLLYTSPSPRD